MTSYPGMNGMKLGPKVYEKHHTGVFDLKIISNNAILLVISISTTFVPLGSCRVSNEANNFKEIELLGLSCCFSVMIEKL